MNNIIGERLRELREHVGFSQDKVAKIIGVSRPAYVNYENGKSKPTRKLKELAKLFNVTVDYILGESADDILTRVPMVAEEREQYIVNKDEHDFVQACRKLSPDKRQAVLTLMKSMAEK